MSDAQVLAWFDHEREEDASPKLKAPAAGAPRLTARQLYARLLYSYGITDPADVERLWAEEQARRAAAEAKTPARKGKAHRVNSPRPRPRR